jgi:flagellar basal-body rod protein FlgG
MVSGIQALVPSMQAQSLRQEVLANNLANISTAGFKRDDLILAPPGTDAGALAGNGVNVSPALRQPVAQFTDFSPGPVRETGRALDAALTGPGFFVVDTPAGQRYTRNGGFTRSVEGYLATADGARVLGTKGPIVIRSAVGVTVGPEGDVQEDGRVIDTLRVVDFPSPYRLLKEGNGLFVAAGAEPTIVRAPQVVGGALEASNVNSVETMVSMIDLLRKYEAAQRSVQSLDEANQVANDIGKVSA